MAPLRQRILPILAVLLGAPVSAEFLQAYLSYTGDPLALLGAVLFFAPLYGVAALLIREAAVRFGRGWSGVLLLGAAFGVAMSGLIDLSMFGEHRADIPFWAEMRDPTLIDALGIGGFNTLTWVAGHAVMSVGVPLALLYRFAPAQRGQPLLGKVGIPVAVLAFLVVAAMVHADGRTIYGYAPSVGQALGVVAVVAALVALAFTPLGRPLASDVVAGERVRATWIAVGAALGTALPALFPPTWAGAAVQAGALAVAVGTVAWLATHREWGAREVGVLAGGAVVGGTLMGFLNPTPDGASTAAKVTQNVVLLVLALAITALAGRRATPPPPR